MAAPSGPPGTVIARAELTIPPGARAAALGSLDAAVWPRSGPSEEAWLILRRIAVTAEPWSLGTTAAAVASEMDARAVDGWRAGDGDDAVRFASRAELLARLSRDIATGRAAGLWFWQSVAPQLGILPAPVALARLWSAEPLRLPAILRALATRDALGDVLATLDRPGVKAVTAAVAAATEWRLESASRAPPLPTGMEPPASAASPLPVPVSAVALALALATAAPDGPARQATVRLMAIAALWQLAPHLLTGAERAPALIDALVAALGSRWAAPRAHEAGTPGKPDDERRRLAARSDLAPEAPPRLPAGDVDGAPERHPPRSVARAADGDPLSPIVSPGRARGSSVEVPPPLRAPEESLITPWGGVFFLLNVLDRPPARDIVRDGAAPGWLRLWRLALALGLEPEPALARFFAARLDLPGADALSRLGPAPDEETLHVALARRYRPMRIWDASLLVRPAVVRSTLTHLDLDLRLADVRLDVRRAGLDVDPGWLPWLGRVVSFHYGAPPELAGYGEDFDAGRGEDA